MTALWIAGWIIMVLCAAVLVALSFLPENERAGDIRCGVDCAILVALACYAEGLIFGASGVGTI